MTIVANPDTGETFYLDASGQWQKAQTAVNPQTREMFAYDPSAQTWEKVATQGRGVLGFVDDAIRSIASGVTFGYADEIAAKANELTGHGTYQQNLQQEQARDAAIPAAVSIPGQIAGGVAGAVAAAPVTGAVSAATGIARLPALARAALGGAAAGGLYGSGNADSGLANRVVGGIEGAGIGAATGAAVSGLANTAANIVAPRTVANAEITRALARDSMTPAGAEAAGAASARPGVATLADVGGENVKGLLERVAQTPGAGRTIAVPALTERQTQQLNRVSDDLAELTGAKKTAFAAISDTMAERASGSKPLYDAAMTFDAASNPQVAAAWEKATETGWGKQILNSSALRRNLQSEFGVKDVTDAPLMAVIDAWGKTARDAVGAALRQGNNNAARVIGDVRNSVLDAVKEANPAYGEAMSKWAGKSAYLDAIEAGKEIVSRKLSAEELASKLATMGESEQEGFRIGAVSAIRGLMGNDAAKLADMTKYLRSPEMRAKISAMMPTDEAAQKWADRLNFEIGSSELVGRSLKNSATARRLAERSDASSIMTDLVADAFMGTPGVGLVRKLIGGTVGRVRDTLRSRTDREIAQTLTSPGALSNLQNRLRSGAAVPSLNTTPAIVGANAAINQ